ncbi:MAG: reverse transcriptase domain-containing protein [Armatimonadota bacterium]
MKIAEIRHDAIFFHRVSANQPSAEQMRRTLAADLDGLFPRRRLWQKYRKRPKDREHKVAKTLNLDALLTAVRVLMRTTPASLWVEQLHARVTRIRDRALHDGNFRFSSPLVVGAQKKPGAQEYRPISMYGMDDKIIERLTSRYLRDRLDYCFSTSSLAYRGRQQGQKSAVTHHDALHRIMSFRMRHSRVFVGEADLRNFMDCIGHEVARESLHDLIRQGKSLRPDLGIAPRSIQIYDAYLASYSFKHQVLGQGLSILKEQDPRASYPWPEEILRKMHGCDNDLAEIGIPQGGALSCLITNVVMHSVDQAIENLRKPEGPEIEYLRYCDDMLIMSPNAVACQEAMMAYERAVERKKLPMHAPKEIWGRGSDSKSKSDFWNLKSKKPYLWSRAADSGIPCIQFVGYLIRYDGLVRIRQKSLKKHRQKLTDATDKLLRVINPGRKSKDGIPVYARGLRMNPHQIEHCFEMKLISMSVGRRKFWQPLPVCGDDIMRLCWAKGYKGLWQVHFDPSGLKELDRHRHRQMQRLRHKLRHLQTPSGIPKVEGREKEKRHFHGAPYSYHGQFVRLTNQDVRSRGGLLQWIHWRVEVLAADARRWLKQFMVSTNSLRVGCVKFLRRHRRSE